MSITLPRSRRFLTRTAALFAGSALLAVALPTTAVQAEDPPPQPAQAVIPPGDLEAILAPLSEDRLFRDSTVAVQVVDVSTGEEVYGYDSERALTPASTMKIVTAATALTELGPSYTWSTRVVTDGELLPDGTLDGDLYIQGTGDPTFVIEDLWKMVYDLELVGVQRVSGNVYFDDTFMTPERGVPGWTKQSDIDNGPAYFPSLGALSLNFNTVAVVVHPGPDVGGPAVAAPETVAPGIVKVENEVLTGAPGTRRRIALERQVTGSTVTFKMTGTIPQDDISHRYYRAVPDSKAYFTAAFAQMMKDQGIKVSGKYLDGEVPDADLRTFVHHRSPKLSAVLATTNKHSNNFMAEQVLKTIGAEVAGEGSTTSGLLAVEGYLAELGIDPAEFTLVNGSGLSRSILLKPSHLTAVLVDMADDDQVGPEFRASLAIAGRDGTLWKRFRGDDDYVGRVRGKTGTLNAVHCLTGYIDGGDGHEYAFAFLVNDLPYSIARARQAHDDLARAVMDLETTGVAVSAAP